MTSDDVSRMSKGTAEAVGAWRRSCAEWWRSDWPTVGHLTHGVGAFAQSVAISEGLAKRDLLNDAAVAHEGRQAIDTAVGAILVGEALVAEACR